MGRSWTDIHFSFSLPNEDCERLDDLTRGRGTSLGLQFKRILIECMREARVDPAHLDDGTQL